MLSLAAFAIRQGKALISKSYRCKYGCWTYYLPMLENFNIFFFYVSSPYFIIILQRHILWRWVYVLFFQIKRTHSIHPLLSSFWTTLSKLSFLLWKPYKNTQSCSYEPPINSPLRNLQTTAAAIPAFRTLLPRKTLPGKSLRLISSWRGSCKHGQFLEQRLQCSSHEQSSHVYSKERITLGCFSKCSLSCAFIFDLQRMHKVLLKFLKS